MGIVSVYVHVYLFIIAANYVMSIMSLQHTQLFFQTDKTHKSDCYSKFWMH